jgi:hypothetical protein
LNSEVLGIKETAGDSTARFALGLRKNVECGFSSSASTSDPQKITVSITPEESQLNGTFDIFLVASLNSQILMLSPVGELIPFSGNIGDLIAFIYDVKLSESFEFTLYEGNLNSALNLDLFLAYLTSSGEFVFTPTPLNLKIIE